MKQIFTPLAATALLFFSFLLTAEAQRAKFGKIDEAELSMKVFENDTSAVAVVLSDFGSSRFTFNNEVQLVFERQMRIKILKKPGYSWANIEVPYYQKGSNKEKVTTIKGFTYNLENGKITKDKLNTSNSFDEQRSENWFIKKFTMPNVKEGSVIEFTYTVTSDFIYNLRDWEFQTSVPTLWSEYQALIPQYYDYKFLQQGYQKIYTPAELGLPHHVQNEGYRWIAKDVPALKEEKYITTLKNYVSKIEFELTQVKYPGESSRTMTDTWEKMVTDLMNNQYFGRELNRTGFFKDHMVAITATHTEPRKQMEAIYNYVRNRMSWDGRQSIYTDGTIRKAYENRKGNVAEINLMLTALLQEAGLEVSPVILSTRAYGKPYKETPHVNKFNYVIAHVKIEGEEFLLDATDPLLPAGMLPERSLNGEGYLVKKGGARWVPLKPANIYAKSVLMNIAINNDGSIQGEGNETVNGYNALQVRRSIREEGKEKYIGALARESGDFKVGNHTIEHIDELDKPVNINYKVTRKGDGEAKTVLYLNPILGSGEKENPFKVSQRFYPVDFAAPRDQTIVCNYTIPAGWVVDESPKSVRVNLPANGGSFVYMVQQQGNTLQVMSKVSIAKPVYNPEEYPALRELFNQIVAKHAEQIVLKKQM